MKSQKTLSLLEAGKPLPLKKSSFEITGSKVGKSHAYAIQEKHEWMDTGFCAVCHREGLYRVDDPICVVCRTWGK